jgi:hypothetical protein
MQPGLVVADADDLRRPEVVAINVEITLHILVHLQHASARSILRSVAGLILSSAGSILRKATHLYAGKLEVWVALLAEARQELRELWLLERFCRDNHAVAARISNPEAKPLHPCSANIVALLSRKINAFQHMEDVLQLDVVVALHIEPELVWDVPDLLALKRHAQN